VLFGYFLAPADGDQDDGLHPEHAVCISRFGDLGILRGRWPLLGQVEDVGAYPVPQFVARPSLGGEFVVAYRDDDVGVVLSRTPVRAGTDGLPEDGLAGFGYVEQRLARLLSERR
jgi:hypothetical protein